MNKLRNLLRPKTLLSGLVLAIVLATGYGFATQKAVEAAVDCDDNAIIKCGYSNLSDFLSKFQANPYGDLQNIYGNWGVNGNTLANQGQHVTVYKNGEVKTDDGTIVATNAKSMGRKAVSGNRNSMAIAGKTYYYGSTQDNFGVGALDGYALFNSDDHSMMMVALKACGNPVWGTSPGYKCQMLKQTKVSDTEYKFVATPYTKDGASVTKIVYEFGDGKSQTVTSNFGQEVKHTYAPGSYTARATVYFSVNGWEKSDTRQECAKPVEVPKPKPVYTCTALVAKQVDGSRTKFNFTATAKTENGAILKTGTFKFDDNSTNTVDANGNTVTTTHEYTKEGDHTTSVDLTFNEGTDKENVKCKVVTKTVPETCADTPTKPECNPTPPPVTPPETPAELPSTGPAEIISTALGLGTVTGASVYYRSSRRNLIDVLLKRH